jgi:hypothetical protein
MKKQPAKAWSMTGPNGEIWPAYTAQTKSDLILDIEQHLGPWREFQRKGYKIVRVTITLAKKGKR